MEVIKIARPKYSFYLGCVIPNRYPFIEQATRNVCRYLGIDLIDMIGASCCPAPGVFRGFDIPTWLVIGARNIVIAEENEADISLMCNGCYGSLLEVNHILKNDRKKRKIVNEHLAKIGKEFKGTIKVKHIIEVLYKDIGIERIKKRLKKDKVEKLNLNFAPHYGCHILKPVKTRPWHQEFEDPRFLDELIEAVGGKSIDYKDKHMCCGAGGGVRSSFKEVSLDFTREKLVNMTAAGADAIVTICPFCHLQFDLGQVEVNNIFKDKIDAPFKIPVIYYTQLLGLAMGMEPKDLGLIKMHNLAGVPPFIPVEPLLKRIDEEIG